MLSKCQAHMRGAHANNSDKQKKYIGLMSFLRYAGMYCKMASPIRNLVAALASILYNLS